MQRKWQLFYTISSVLFGFCHFEFCLELVPTTQLYIRTRGESVGDEDRSQFD
jgi:hypothetical protein